MWIAQGIQVINTGLVYEFYINGSNISFYLPNDSTPFRIEFKTDTEAAEAFEKILKAKEEGKHLVRL